MALTLLAGAGCAQLGPQPTFVPPTKTPKPTFTPTTAALPTQTALPAPTTAAPTAAQPPPPPTATLAPTAAPPTATATPIPAPKFTANQSVNVRRGPGTNYGLIGEITQGQSHDITGKNAAGDWLQFNFRGQPAWVFAALVAVSGDAGRIQLAQNIPAPPPPPPTAAPTPVPQPTAPSAPPAPLNRFQLLKNSPGEHCDPNSSMTYFDGFVRHRDNSLYNHVCVHIRYYEPRVTKCTGCDGVGDGFWSFSPFGRAADPGTYVEIFVVECPPSIPAGGVTQNTPGGFSGSNLTPLSDKWTKVINESVECHGITFVGD
ncbi:MAG: hypothetical protein FJ011_03015 [Chloroflexi bacterium]|nr:hypothetical protein [Chloroflexota bacterium]